MRGGGQGLHGDVLVARVHYLFIRKKRAHIMPIALKMGSLGAYIPGELIIRIKKAL